MEENKAKIPVIEIPKIKVYVKIDTNKIIKEINSSVFLADTTGWVNIDEGYGDKYSHAQSQYLEKVLIDIKGRYNYKWDNKLVELTEEEKDILFPVAPPKPTEIEKLKSDIDFLSIINTDLESKTISQQSDIDYLLILQEG